MTNHKKLKILIANGVNLDILGSRQPEIYGFQQLKDLENGLSERRLELQKFFGCELEFEFFQSNHEGAFLDELSKPWDGAVINPAAWTHTSLALADRLAGIDLKFVEVHISNISRREEIRQKSLTAKHAIGVVYGFGIPSYITGLFGLLESLID
ncbi:MAG: 3-dehydroquinate dehydratase [Pseudobacteriovorax sp.]|nr:3-dehydroquinate dehydratase [Pseudobacteriovorax sp.]